MSIPVDFIAVAANCHHIAANPVGYLVIHHVKYQFNLVLMRIGSTAAFIFTHAVIKILAWRSSPQYVLLSAIASPMLPLMLHNSNRTNRHLGQKAESRSTASLFFSALSHGQRHRGKSANFSKNIESARWFCIKFLNHAWEHSHLARLETGLHAGRRPSARFNASAAAAITSSVGVVIVNANQTQFSHQFCF